jgi:enamine deaminase RidA (YjgF/YER057c/UK114 family)
MSVHGFRKSPSTATLSTPPASSPTNVDVATQTGQILDKIDGYLKEAGTDKTNIVSTTIWLADIKDFAAMNSVWDQWVPKGNTPPRACVESKLATPAYKVEIRVIAAK